MTPTTAEPAAHLGDEFLAWVFEHAPLGIVLYDANLQIIRANGAFAHLLGSSPERLTGCSFWQGIHPQDRERGRAAIRRVENRELTWITMHLRCLRQDGQDRWGEFVTGILWTAKSEFLSALSIVRDISDTVADESAQRDSEPRTRRISEQRRIEDERARAEAASPQSLAELEQAQMRLQLADRMSAMGTLAAGVAHEINNPLGFVVANLGFALEEVGALRAHPLTPALPERLTALTRALGEAQEGANRVRDIVLDLRTFSRPHAEMSGPVDVRRVLESVVNMAKAETVSRARVVRHFHEVPPVLGNEARLSQLFLNLIVNAVQAIPSTEERPSSAIEPIEPLHEIHLTLEQTAIGAVRISIADTGKAIAPEHLGRVFDPFFAGNPVGRGTGLGLSICHEIVDSLGGQISVSSSSGAGTTFRVVLPAADVAATAARVAAAAQVPDAPATIVLPSPRTARILVVDDEPLMGSAIARVLSNYEVTALTSARTALSRLAAGERFDVILCDVMMPDFSGIDLYDAVAKAAPDLLGRMIFVTGGAYTQTAIDFLDRVPNARLEKPILPQVLQTAVATMLHTLGMAPNRAPA